jgi:hypothetical protein
LRTKLPSFRQQAHVLKNILDSAGRLHTEDFARFVRQVLETMWKTIRQERERTRHCFEHFAAAFDLEFSFEQVTTTFSESPEVIE